MMGRVLGLSNMYVRAFVVRKHLPISAGEGGSQKGSYFS